MNWNIERAKKWMFDTGMAHIRGGTFLTEGAELIHDAESGENHKTLESFKILLHDVLWWDAYDINDAIGEVLSMSEPEKAKDVLTVKQIMNQLIEPHPTAWMALPDAVRELMIDHPEKFELREDSERGTPLVVYNGVVFRVMYGSSKEYWLLHSIDVSIGKD